MAVLAAKSGGRFAHPALNPTRQRETVNFSPGERPISAMRHSAVLLSVLMAFAVVSRAETRAQLSWQGEVNGRTILRIHDDKVEAINRRGDVVSQLNYRFSSPLPTHRELVQVSVLHGQGDVRITQQPREDNGYVLTVSIMPQGANHQRFALEFAWESQRDRFNDRSSGDPYSGPRDREPGDSRYRRADNRLETSVTPGGGTVVWNGRVDQAATIEFRGRQMEARSMRGNPVESAHATFSAAIPADGSQVRLQDVRGPGRVEIVQQPSSQNGYVAAVRVDDPGRGGGDYSFTLVWNGGEPAIVNQSTFHTQLGFNGMRWAGRVDERVRITVQGDHISTEVLQGAPIYNERAEFSSALTSQSIRDLRINKVRGRGSVNVLERPSVNNGYRLVFEVDDPEGGADDYQVDVIW